MPLPHYKILSLGFYGTLVDRDSGIHAALRPLLARARQSLSPGAALEAFARHEAERLAAEPELSYAQGLEQAHRSLAREWGILGADDEHLLFARSASRWPVYADTMGALQYLTRYYRLVIVSDGDREDIGACLRRLEVRCEAILTAAEAHGRKASGRPFQLLIERLGRSGSSPAQALHAGQSVAHDLLPAASAGLPVAWIDRKRESVERGTTVASDYVFRSLAGLVRAHQEQLRA